MENTPPCLKKSPVGIGLNVLFFMIKIFRNFGEEATIYAGDLKREESILEWMMVQKDPSNEVKKNDATNERTIDESDRSGR